MKGRSLHRRSGFTLLDLVLTVTALSVFAGLALPSLYEPRRLENEACAQDLLYMITSAEKTWMNEKQTFVTLPRLAEPLSSSTSVSYPVLPFFVPNQRGEFRYCGYAFSMEVQEDQLVFIARPVLSGYSGTQVFQASVPNSSP